MRGRAERGKDIPTALRIVLTAAVVVAITEGSLPKLE